MWARPTTPVGSGDDGVRAAELAAQLALPSTRAGNVWVSRAMWTDVLWVCACPCLPCRNARHARVGSLVCHGAGQFTGSVGRCSRAQSRCKMPFDPTCRDRRGGRRRTQVEAAIWLDQNWRASLGRTAAFSLSVLCKRPPGGGQATGAERISLVARAREISRLKFSPLISHTHRNIQGSEKKKEEPAQITRLLWICHYCRHPGNSRVCVVSSAAGNDQAAKFKITCLAAKRPVQFLVVGGSRPQQTVSYAARAVPSCRTYTRGQASADNHHVERVRAARALWASESPSLPEGIHRRVRWVDAVPIAREDRRQGRGNRADGRTRSPFGQPLRSRHRLAGP